jgi:hypothetical protein
VKEQCEGENCDAKENLQLVKVTNNSNGFKWGQFTYCPKCIHLDLSRGFTVERYLSLKEKAEYE